MRDTLKDLTLKKTKQKKTSNRKSLHRDKKAGEAGRERQTNCVSRGSWCWGVVDIKSNPFCVMSSGFIAYLLVVIQKQRAWGMKNSDRRNALSSFQKLQYYTHWAVMAPACSHVCVWEREIYGGCLFLPISDTAVKIREWCVFLFPTRSFISKSKFC